MSENNYLDTTTDILGDDSPKIGIRRQPSLKLNVLSNWVALAVNIITGLLLTPVIMVHLGEDRFGMWMLVFSIAGYFGILRLGVGTGVLRYASLFRGKDDYDKVNSIVSTSMAFYMIVGLLILAVCWFLGDSISAFFKGDKEFATLIRVVGLVSALECISLIFDAVIKSYEGFIYTNMVAVIVAVLRAAALLWCIYMGYGLVPMGWAVVIVTFIAVIARGITFKVNCTDVRIRITEINLSVLKLLILYGLVIMIESGAYLLTVQSPKLIIGKVVSLKAVGFFGIAYLLINYYGHLIWAVSKVFMPRFSYLSGKRADSEIRRLFLRGSRYVTIMAGLVASLIWTVGPPFLNLWTKNDNISQAFPALIIIAVGSMAWLSHRLSIDLLYGLGRQKKLALFATIEGVSVFGLSLALSYKYGMTGVAVGASVPLLLVRGGIQTMYVCRLLKISFWKYYSDYIIKSWIISGVLSITVWWTGIMNVVNKWFSLFLISGLLVLVYCMLTYMIAIQNEERYLITNRVLAVLKRFAPKVN